MSLFEYQRKTTPNIEQYAQNALVSGNAFANARVYLQAVNLFTITKYTGLDPELRSGSDQFFGVDRGNLPANKQFLVGVSFGF